MSHKSAFQSWTRFDQNRIFFHISISCLNWDWGKVKNERRREGDKAADLNFAWSSFLLFFSPSSYEKKVGRWSVANECKVLIPLQFSLMMNTVPKGQIFFSHTNSPTSSSEKKKLKLQYSYLQCNSTNDFRLVFSGHIFEPSTDVRTVCCVRKIEEKEWESYFDGRWCLSSLFHQTCRSHFSHPIYRILNFTPARTLNNWAKGKSHLFSLAIEIQVPFLHP